MLALCHSEERSTRKGYAASVRQQSCQRLRSDVGIRNPKVGNMLILVSFRNGFPRRPVGPPYPFCPFGTFPLDKGNRPRNDRLF